MAPNTPAPLSPQKQLQARRNDGWISAARESGIPNPRLGSLAIPAAAGGYNSPT